MTEQASGPNDQQDKTDASGGLSKAGYQAGDELMVPLANLEKVPREVCIKCGQPAAGTVVCSCARRSIGWKIFEVFGPLGTFILGMLGAHLTFDITVGLCQEHRRIRFRRRLAVRLLVLASIVVWIGFRKSGWMSSGTAFLMGLGLFVSGLVLGYFTLRYPVRILRRGKHHIVIQGSGEGYRRQFRQF